MVDGLTRVTAEGDGERAERLAAALAELGFTVTRGRKGVVGDSTAVGGRETKELLRARGFADREYRIFVEYVRQWGIL